jgi:hypothetical protein
MYLGFILYDLFFNVAMRQKTQGHIYGIEPAPSWSTNPGALAAQSGVWPHVVLN